MNEGEKKDMIKLNGLQVEQFAHPDDSRASQAIEKAKINAVIEWISSKYTKLQMKTMLLGKFVRLNEQDMPQLYSILTEVCETLDFYPVPQVFTYRSPLFDYQIYVGDSPVIILTDFVLNDFDEGMLRYHLGCAVTALKAKTCQLRVAVTFGLPLLQSIPVLGTAALPLLTNWSRKAYLTEDRGGLLACQDIEAAVRTQMRIAGLPRKDIDPSCVRNYITECRMESGLTTASQYMQTVFRGKPWQNDRIVELIKWYDGGAYHDVIEEYE